MILILIRFFYEEVMKSIHYSDSALSSTGFLSVLIYNRESKWI